MRATMMNEITKRIPAPLTLPAESLPLKANSLPWSLGSLFLKIARSPPQRITGISAIYEYAATAIGPKRCGASFEVTKIAKEAFADQTRIKSVVVGRNVTVIEEEATEE